MSSGAGRIVVHYLEAILAHVGARGFGEMDAEISSEFDDADRRVEALEERIAVLEERDVVRARRAIVPLVGPGDGVHEAGLLVDGIQQCRRCFAVLCDYRGAMQLSSDPVLTGYKPGANVETVGPGSLVTESAPTCEARS